MQNKYPIITIGKMGQLPETHKCHEWVTLQQTIIICKNTLIKKSHRATSAHKCSEVSEILPKNNFLKKSTTKMEETKPEMKKIGIDNSS